MIFSKKYQRFSLFLVLCGAVLNFSGSRVFAATDKLPDVPSGQFTNIGTSTQVGDVYLSVAAAGANYALDAPEATVKLFVKDDGRATVTVRINNAAWCPNNFSPPGVNIDSLAGAPREFPDTAFIFYSATASEAMSVPLTFFGNAALDCNNANTSVFRDPTITLNMSSLTPTTVLGHGGYRVAYIRAQNNGFANGINSFSITAQAQDKLSYYAGSGNKFALGQLWLDPDRWSDMRLQFAPSCTVSVATNVDILWFDADAGESNQTDTNGNPNTIATILYEVSSTGVRTPVNFWPLTGGNGVSGGKTITVQPGKRYEWELLGVKSRNGIQFQLPYDSINFDQNCTPPPPPPPGPTIACSPPTIFTLGGSSTPEAGEPFYSTVNISNSPSTAITYTGGTASLAVAPSPTSGSPQSGISVPNIPGGSSVNVTSGPIVANTAGTYSIDWNVTGGNAVAINCPGTVSFDVVTKPFFRVREGDVGAGITTIAPGCKGWGVGSSVSLALVAWNNGVAGSSNIGAGTNLAAIARTLISGVSSAQGRTSAPTALNGLSFANIVFGLYGGLYPGGIDCPTDYYATLPTGTTTIAGSIAPNTIGNTARYAPAGSLTVNGTGFVPIGLFTPGARPIIYVNGDAYINGNITLAPGGAATVDLIPNFYLVAKGNIYIAPNVTRLDGVYIAQPILVDSNADGDFADPGESTKGNIYTCAFQWRAPTSPEVNGVCKTKLDVYGAFIAKELKLYRSFGTLRGNTTAETFTSKPATWLAAPCAIGGCGSAPTDGYDAITSLPPVL